MSNFFCTNGGCGSCESNCQTPTHPCCPCGDDFHRALELLCCPQLRSLIDFNAFAFVSGFYVLGAAIQMPPCSTAPGDNLSELNGRYVCGGDSCETITVSGLLYPPVAGCSALKTTVTQAVLCRLIAVAFDAASGSMEDAEENFQAISQILGQLLRPKCQQECCTLADALTNAALRSSTVVAGPLVVENSTILGQIGNILVLANSTDHRFYFICVSDIDFIG